MVAVIGWPVSGERGHLADHVVSVGLAVLAFNVLSLLIGYGVPRLAGVDRRAATATGFEVGIHNSTLAITIALSPALLDNAQMAVPGAVYGIVMFFTAAAFGWLVTRNRSTGAATTQEVAV